MQEAQTIPFYHVKPRTQKGPERAAIKLVAMKALRANDGMMAGARWMRSFSRALKRLFAKTRPVKSSTTSTAPMWRWMDRSINMYRGCEHGCIYCFARPSHAYLGYSPGLDFETQLFVKSDAPGLLAKELS